MIRWWWLSRRYTFFSNQSSFVVPLASFCGSSAPALATRRRASRKFTNSFVTRVSSAFLQGDTRSTMGSQCVRDACTRAEDESELTFGAAGGKADGKMGGANGADGSIQNNNWYSVNGNNGVAGVAVGSNGQPLKPPDVDSKGRKQGYGEIQEVGYKYQGNFKVS